MMIFEMDYEDWVRIRNKGDRVSFYVEMSDRFDLFMPIGSFTIKTTKMKSDLNMPAETFVNNYLSRVFRANSVEYEGRYEHGTEGSTPLIEMDVFRAFKNSMKKFVGWSFANSRYWIVEWFKKYDFPLITGITEEERKEIKRIIVEGLEKGTPFSIVERQLVNLLEDENKVEMILRTELNKGANESALERYEINGVKKVIWHAILDNRTSEICRKNHGKEFTLKQAKGRLPAHVNCYDKETEVYTSKGWKLFKNLKGEKIMSLNPDNFNLEFVDYKKLIKYHYKGEMIHFKNRITDLLVTPDHQMFVGKRRNWKDRKEITWKFVEAKNLINSEYKFHKSSNWSGKDIDFIKIGSKEIFVEDFCRFMGYYLSDGSVTKSSKNSWRIKISQHGDNRHIIHDSIKNMPYKIKMNEDSLNIYDRELGDYLSQFGKCNEKYIPDEIKQLDKRYLRMFLDAFCFCDGVIRKGKFWKGYKFKDNKCYFTTSERMAGDLGELIIKCGKSVYFKIEKSKGKRVEFSNGVYELNYDLWRIYENNSKNSSSNKIKITKTPYDDMVYCVELPKFHTLLVRRNGKVNWCGNCRSVWLPVIE